MKITRLTYDSPVDALIAVTKHLTLYEKKYRMNSETFFHMYRSGQMEDSEEFIEWSNDYQHYIHQKTDHFPDIKTYPHQDVLPTIKPLVTDVIRETVKYLSDHDS